MMTETKTKTYTPAEYLEIEISSDTRNEYHNGEIITMTGGTPEHNDIAGNLYILLKLALKNKNYRTFYVDQRLWIPAAKIYAYPDVMVLPKPIELQSGRKDTVINPCLIAEVLSKSTQNFDRGDKFAAYRSIPTFQEYLLIDQYRIHVEHYVKTSVNQWIFSEYDDVNISLSLGLWDFSIQIADIYENIDFDNPG